jgi:hypothetical protein
MTHDPSITGGIRAWNPTLFCGRIMQRRVHASNQGRWWLKDASLFYAFLVQKYGTRFIF